MITNEKFIKSPQESIDEYKSRIYQYKYEFDLTWEQVADIVNDQLGTEYSGEACRCQNKKLKTMSGIEAVETLQDAILEYKKERVKLSDERTQNNAYIRALSREDTLKEIAKDCVDTISKKLPILKGHKPQSNNWEKEAILEISDWHYGIDCKNAWNIYNPEIAKERINKLQDKVIDYIHTNKIKKLHIVNLSDLIAGRIHLQIRIESRFDVITQTIEVSELLAQFIANISKYCNIEYYDCCDNHSRIEPNKKESLQLESLSRITHWYIRDRFSEISFVNINENEFGDDIITFNACGLNVVGVHGDKDKPNKVVPNLSLMIGQKFDLILTAHLHHFSCDEVDEALIISNGSLMGTDTYAVDLRLKSKPSQNMIILSKEDGVESIHKITL